MNKTKIAATITLVAMVTNFSASTTSVLAYELSNKDEVTSSTSNKIIQAHQSSSANGDDATKESKNKANSLEAEINLKRLITRCLKSIIQRLQVLRAMMDLQLKIL